MSSRDTILGALRQHRKPFSDAAPPPDAYIPVTRFGAEDRLTRFTAEVAQRFGTVHAASDPQAAIQIVLSLLEADKIVMAWEDLPLPGLLDALRDQQIQVVNLRARHDERLTALEAAEPIRVGIREQTRALRRSV